jgi:cytochrome bd-type quinol oxidase subunit 2
MPKLKDKIRTTLDEGRMLILGVQVLIGFEFRSVLEKTFDTLPVRSRYVELCSLCLMLIAVLLLMWPGVYHRLVDDGEDTDGLHRFATTVIGLSLLPIALGMGTDFFVASERLLGFGPAVVVAVLVTLTAIFFWYVLEAISRSKRGMHAKEKVMSSESANEHDPRTDLQAKIEQVLLEIRVVLPGAQALLGFQFAALLMEGFDKLPQSSKYVHFAGLLLMALAIILMMTPAAYHRLVEKGENTERLHRLSSKMLLSSMALLALGICAELFVVGRKITSSLTASILLAIFALTLFYGCWFGYTYYRSVWSYRQNRAEST